MNPGNYLFDTNALIRLQSDPEFIKQFDPQQSRLFIPVIALGELYFGAEKSSRPDENFLAIEPLAGTMPILPIDQETAEYYGRLKAKLEKIGRPPSENDLWIASLAVQHDLQLVSQDQHFQTIAQIIPALKVVHF